MYSTKNAQYGSREGNYGLPSKPPSQLAKRTTHGTQITLGQKNLPRVIPSFALPKVLRDPRQPGPKRHTAIVTRPPKSSATLSSTSTLHGAVQKSQSRSLLATKQQGHPQIRSLNDKLIKGPSQTTAETKAFCFSSNTPSCASIQKPAPKCTLKPAPKITPHVAPKSAHEAVVNVTPRCTARATPRTIVETIPKTAPRTLSDKPPSLKKTITSITRPFPPPSKKTAPAKAIASKSPSGCGIVKSKPKPKSPFLPKVLSQPLARRRSASMTSKTAATATEAEHANADHATKAGGNIFTSGRLPQKKRSSISMTSPDAPSPTTPHGDTRLTSAASESSRETSRKIIMKKRRDRAPVESIQLFEISQIQETGLADSHSVGSTHPKLDSETTVVDTNDNVVLMSQSGSFEKMVRFDRNPQTWDCESTHAVDAKGEAAKSVQNIPRHRQALNPRSSIRLQSTLQKEHAHSTVLPSVVSVKKHVVFRNDSPVFPSSQPIEALFSGVNTALVPGWFEAFNALSGLEFSHLCSIQALQKQIQYIWRSETLLSSGAITSTSTPDVLENVAQRLRIGAFCAVSFQGRYFVVIYPSHCQVMSLGSFGLEQPTGTDASLYYFIFEIEPEAVPPMLPIDPVPDPKFHERKLVYERLFSFDYQRLLPTNASDPHTLHAFYLVFPPSKIDMMSAFCSWLRECNPKCRILTSQQPGHMDIFRREAKCGTLVIHDNALSLIRHMPTMFVLLATNNSAINFWSFSDASQLFPLVPSTTEPGIRSSPAKLSMTPILERGAAILVTPTFILFKTHRFVPLLQWFKDKSSDDWAYRIVVPAGVTDLMLELAAQDGITNNVRQDRYRAWELLCELTEEGIHPEDDLCGSKVVVAPDLIHPYDEQSLINWFSTWSILNIDRHREFFVLATHETDRRSFTHVVLPPVDFKSPSKSTPNTIYESSSLTALRSLDDQEMTDAPTGPPTGPRAFNSRLLPNDRGATIHRYLEKLHDKNRDSFLLLYHKPVACYNIETSNQFDDPWADYSTTFNGWFKFLRPFNWKKRAYAGMFYTPAKLDSGTSKFTPNKPWIGIYRPAHPSRWLHSHSEDGGHEIIIWDPNACLLPKRQTEELFISDLDNAHQQFIEFLKDQAAIKGQGTYIESVWITGFNLPSHYHGLPIDATLLTIENAMERPIEFLPSSPAQLKQAGFIKVQDSNAQPPSIADSFTATKTGPEPSMPPTNKPQYMVVHPPPPLESDGTSTEYRNHFYDAVTEAVQKNGRNSVFKYLFMPTTVWYKSLRYEQRDYSHIMVLSWGQAFKNLGIFNRKKGET
ncbi:hypothetical protein CFIMG_008449RA00001 [Ceratocystis fimbriata CBS 114723]|uniref:Uncharacterized protein n=1 Tax=Ceratocystis fimbriata CBS 114723 TaxID=1035309 RepID=A0A2C5X357_9PEZI|nr:hypothetical protein CFIMG_008449RA00001 [Ceratocystis fimbriata CBS 114723]